MKLSEGTLGVPLSSYPESFYPLMVWWGSVRENQNTAQPLHSISDPFPVSHKLYGFVAEVEGMPQVWSWTVLPASRPTMWDYTMLQFTLRDRCGFGCVEPPDGDGMDVWHDPRVLNEGTELNSLQRRAI